MASLRNLVIGLLRLAGHAKIARALRWIARNPPVRWRCWASDRVWWPRAGQDARVQAAVVVDAHGWAACVRLRRPRRRR
jgi:hypothetical protein